jgi:pimeloyl-ACP methyl ester carboxylesterase
MSNQRTHYVTTSNGVTIGATVHGQGPPLVFLHGVIGDGELDWHALLGHLTARFTCHLPSLRGRGLSGDHPDLRFGRLVDDVLAYVDSIGEPTGLVGWSLGAGLALVAAGVQSDAVDAVAAVEPGMPRLMDEQEQAALGDAVARMGELAAEGRLTAAARAFAGFPLKDEDIAVAEGAGYFEAAGRYVPNMLNFFQQQMAYAGPTDDDPAVLGAISAPVLVLLGSDTKPYATRAARHVADHVPNARIHQIPGVGHAAP